MTAAREPWIDWMKAAGITLIVVVHVATAPFVFLTPPIYAKQLGVAFFMFVLGYSLARESRPVRVVLARRLFDIYFWGLLCAVAISAVLLPSSGTANLSNYLPFALGVNVLLDHFPANPTTWYIGMYLHALLAWALLWRRVRVGWAVLLAAAVVEVAARALIAETAGRFVAYMALTNWLVVYLMGARLAQTQESPSRSPGSSDPGAASPAGNPSGRSQGSSDLRSGSSADNPSGRSPGSLDPGALADLLPLPVFAVAWYLLSRPLVAGEDFPWLAVRALGPVPAAVVSSLLVTGTYAGFTWSAWRFARALPALAPVGFLARNTLLVFILHMPIYYVMLRWFAAHPVGYALRSALLIAVCLPVLAVVSDRLLRLMPAEAWRARLVQRVGRGLQTPA